MRLASLTLTAVAALLLALPARAADRVGGSLSASDQQFITETVQGNMTEVRLGKMAFDRSQSETVKSFGERLVTDHSRSNEQLKEIAAAKHVELPQQLSATEEARVTKLEGLSGAEFDRLFMAEMREEHRRDLARFETVARTSTDPELQEFAQRTLPTLREHVALAERYEAARATAGSASGGASAVPAGPMP